MTHYRKYYLVFALVWCVVAWGWAEFQLNGPASIRTSVPIEYDTNDNGSVDIVFSSNSVSVGSSASSHDGLDVTGSYGIVFQTISDNITLSGNSQVLLDTSAGNLTVTMPAPATVAGRLYVIKKISVSNEAHVVGSIDDLGGVLLGTGGNILPMVELISYNGLYHILGYSGNVSGVSSSTSPSIVSITASDNLEASGVTVGDKLYFIFSDNTNTPEVYSKGYVDTLIDFNGELLGGDYEGYWNSTGNMLTIRVLGSIGNTIAIGDTISIKAGAGLNFEDESGSASEATGIVSGSFSAIPIQVPWTPSEISTIGWWDASDNTTVSHSANTVITLADKSTNGYDMSASGTNVTTNGREINNLNVIDMGGSGHLEDLDFPVPADGDVAIFVAATVDSVTSSWSSLFSMDDANGTANDFQFDAYNSSTEFHGGFHQTGIGSAVGSTGGPYHGPSIYNCNFDKTDTVKFNAFVDGTQRVVDTNYSTKLGTPQKFRLGATRNGTNWLDCAIGEAVIISDLSSDTRYKIEGYLAHKWGFSGNLPSGHAYESVAPGIPMAFDNTRNYPLITSITATDGGRVVGVTNGDNIAIVFDSATNIPGLVSKSLVDNLLSFSGNLGSDYSGVWVASNTLVITISDNTESTLVVGDSVTVLPVAGLKFAGNLGNSSSASGVLDGSFDPPVLTITSIQVSDVTSTAGVTAGDNIHITFSGETNIPEVSSTNLIDQLIDFQGNVLGAAYDGYWNPSGDILTITVIDPAGNTLVIGDNISILASANLSDANETARPCDDSGTLSGNFGSLYYPLFTPSEISPVAWYDATDSSTVFKGVSDNVYLWNDKSENGNDATQIVDAQQPTYKATDSTHNSMPTIGNETNTGQIGLDTPSITVKTVYIIMDYEDGVDVNFGYAYQNFLYGTGDKARIMGHLSATSDFFQTVNSTTFYLGGGAYRNGSSSSTISGVLPMPSTLYKVKSGANTTRIFNIGYDPGGSRTTRGWEGSYGELIFTDGTESSDEEKKMESYLAHKWGISGNLEAGHTYISSEPISDIPVTFDNTRNYPLITSVTASDNASSAGIDNGDYVTFVFDGDTNKPNVSTTSDVNNVLSFTGSLGDNYSGVWSSSNTLIVTVVSNSANTVNVGETISILSSGNLKFSANPGNASTATGVLGGSFDP